MPLCIDIDIILDLILTFRCIFVCVHVHTSVQRFVFLGIHLELALAAEILHAANLKPETPGSVPNICYNS